MKDDTSKKANDDRGWGKFRDTILAIAIVSVLVIGFGSIYVLASGVFQKWELLSDPPEKLVHIYIPAKSGGIAGKTLEGIVYLCCWSKRPDLDMEYKYSEFDYPNWTPPAYPGKVIKQVITGSMAPEGFSQTNYILLDNGTVWRWTHRSNLPLYFTIGIGTVILGLPVGILISLLLAIVSWKMIKKKET